MVVPRLPALQVLMFCDALKKLGKEAKESSLQPLRFFFNAGRLDKCTSVLLWYCGLGDI